MTEIRVLEAESPNGVGAGSAEGPCWEHHFLQVAVVGGDQVSKQEAREAGWGRAQVFKKTLWVLELLPKTHPT